MASQLTPEQEASVKEIFNIFDKDRNGSISTSELENVLKALGKNPTQADIDDILKEVDLDKSGAIEFKEFHVMISKKLNSLN